MSIGEAVTLVLQAGEMAKGGEVFVLDMGEPIKVVDLVSRMIKLYGKEERTADNPDGEIAIEYIGLRPGEKMYEELLISGNEERTSNSKIFKSNESFIDDDQLDSVISLATEAVKYNNISDIKELMKRHVDGYKY